MGGAAAAVLQVIAGPDRGIGFVERELLAVLFEFPAEEPPFPRKVTLDELWRYAKINRVTNVMRPYLEAVV